MCIRDRTRAGFFNAKWRTVSGLQGMLFRKLPVVEVPASVKPLLASITESAQPLQIFALEIVEECLTVGRAGVLVDYPVVADEGATQADAILRNLRPTMSLYETESIVNWKEETITSQKVLTRVILKEDRATPDPDDEFTESCGTTVSYTHLDVYKRQEYGNMKLEAWGANVRPALSDRKGWCDLIGVPEGRNHYYDTALKACLLYTSRCV